MIDLKLTEAQLDELHQAASENPRARARRKCWVVYLRGKGYACREIADVVRVDADTVTEYARKYRDGGLFGLLAEDYRRPDGRLDGHAERLKEVFKQRPPHTVSQAIEMIEQETGVRLKPSAGRALLRKLGLRFRRCGLVPGKAPEQRAPTLQRLGRLRPDPARGRHADQRHRRQPSDVLRVVGQDCQRLCRHGVAHYAGAGQCPLPEMPVSL